MVKKLIALKTVTLSGLIYPAIAFAADSALTPPTGSISTSIKPETVPQLAVNLIFYIGMVLAVAYLMYGGIKWITSGGNKEAVSAAKKHILSAVMGLVVVAAAFFIIQFVFTVLGADNPLSKGFALPTLKDLDK